MPSYVELNKNASFPASSSNSKLILGLNANGQAVLVNNNGDITPIGGSVQIPQPIVSITGDTQLVVQFPDTGFDFSSQNPELFLFRWRNNSKSKHNGAIRKKGAKWVHPTTNDAATKWVGWKFFNGTQHWMKKSITTADVFGSITGRTTEWSVASTIKPYEKMLVNFDRYMFWNQFDRVSEVFTYDQNFFLGSAYTPLNHEDGFTYIKVGAQKNTSNAMKFSLALAIDNPLATKTNGLCPKIFGPFSEPFYSIIRKTGGVSPTYSDIILVKETFSRHKHIIKQSGL